MTLEKAMASLLAMTMATGCSASETQQAAAETQTAAPNNAPPATAKGRVYQCAFPLAGTVTIDTSPDNSSITYKGVTYPATSGSYFYQTNDGAIAAMFTPDMSQWGLMGDTIPEEDKVKCRLENE
ncbi:hypothetical protein ACFOWX_11785 [Sphingorhabdus arenilitoris]|uniref:C-type lysozyme inhibitor domain-containing protein n=1 Tax=Sphingorhabdus arenilitoris TaxID=1490041 RepID=A0ABV8RLD6_9SPHN